LELIRRVFLEVHDIWKQFKLFLQVFIDQVALNDYFPVLALLQVDVKDDRHHGISQEQHFRHDADAASLECVHLVEVLV